MPFNPANPASALQYGSMTMNGMTVNLGDDVAVPGSYYSAVAPTRPAVGVIWMDTSGGSPSPKVWTGSAWSSFSAARATVSGTTGSPTQTTITSGSASWNVYTFTSNGSLSLSAGGPVDYLIVGAGGQSTTNSQGGSGGGFVLATQQNLAVGTFSVTVGTTYGASSSFNSQTAGGGSATTSGSPQSNGSATVQSGTYNLPGGAGGRGYTPDNVGGTPGPPLYSDITGISLAYGSGAAHSGGVNGAYGQGDGRTGNTISSNQRGVVIVRVRAT